MMNQNGGRIKVLVVTGGSISIKQLESVYEQGEYGLVYGVDSGMDSLNEAGIIPDVLLGDFDSCDEAILNKYKSLAIEIKPFPPEKDMTDTHLALEIIKAYETSRCNGIRIGSVTLLGATGTRVDHQLSTLYVVAKYSDYFDIEILDNHNRMFIAKEQQILEKNDYNYISLLPLSERVEEVTVEGVKYPLENVTLDKFDSFGISNEIVKDKGFLKKGKGKLLVVQSKD